LITQCMFRGCMPIDSFCNKLFDYELFLYITYPQGLSYEISFEI
jgi:hypothetical protein